MKNTQQTAHGVCLLLLGLVIVGGLVPLAFYWALFGRVATITVDEAKQRLKRQGAETVLVDVRRPEAFLAGHLGGAVNWPIETVLALAARRRPAARLSRQDAAVDLRRGLGQPPGGRPSGGHWSRPGDQRPRRNPRVDPRHAQPNVERFRSLANRPRPARGVSLPRIAARGTGGRRRGVFLLQADLYDSLALDRDRVVEQSRGRSGGGPLGHDRLLRRRERLRGQLLRLPGNVVRARVSAQLRHGGLLRVYGVRRVGGLRSPPTDVERPAAAVRGAGTLRRLREARRRAVRTPTPLLRTDPSALWWWR